MIRRTLSPWGIQGGEIQVDQQAQDHDVEQDGGLDDDANRAGFGEREPRRPCRLVLAGAQADPAVAAVRGERFALLPLESLIELKLASGMTAPHRLRDLADVIELIRVNELKEDFSQSLDAYVRDKYSEMWRAAQIEDEE